MLKFNHVVCQIVHVAKSGAGLEDGARGRVEGDYEGVHKCEIDIQREGARTCVVARSGGAIKINELGGQALLILYEEGQFMNLNHFQQQFSNDHIHISLDIQCARLRDEAEGMDDERGTLDI